MSSRPIGAVWIALAIGGCVAEVGHEDEVGIAAEAILNGDEYSADANQNGFVELLPGTGKMCSGTLLTNRWVLTAAHCFPSTTWPAPVVTVQMNGQSRVARQILFHPGSSPPSSDGTDIALVEVTEPFVMNNSRSGYEQGIYAGPTGDLVGKPLHCFGWGQSVEGDIASARVLRDAILQPESTEAVGGGRYRISWNGVNQMTWDGDSGGSCFWEVHGTRLIATVASSHVDHWHVAQYNLHVPAVSFRDWVLDVLRAQPVSLVGEFPQPLPHNYFSWRGFDPCGGACWSWTAQHQFEACCDFGSVDGVTVRGTGTTTGSACGSVSVEVMTDGSVDSQGFSSLTATCGPHIACHGPDCRTGTLPPGTWISQEWDPCNGFCYEWNLEFEGGTGASVGVNGAYWGPWTWTSGQACGAIPLGVYTASSTGALRLRAQCDSMTVDPVGTGAQSEGAGIAIGDLESDGFTDLFMVAYDAPAGPNQFRVRVARNLGVGGRPSPSSSFISGTFPGVGDLGEGAGIAVTSLDGDPAPELVLMAYDAGPYANDFRLRVLRNVHIAWGASGPFLEAGVVGGIQVVPGVGWVGRGAGIAIGQVTGSGAPDIVLAAFDGAMEHRFRVVSDLSPAGIIGAVSGIHVAPRAPRTDIGTVHGSGVALGQLDADPELELILGTYHWYGEEHAQFRYQVGWDFTGASVPTDWTFHQMPGVGTRGAGMDLAVGRIDGSYRTVLVLAANDDGAAVDAMRWRYVTHDLRDVGVDPFDDP